MPIYEYHCLACGEAFEKLVLGSTRPAVECPGCASRDVARALSVFGVKTAPGVPSRGPSAGSAGGGCCGGGCGCG